MAGSLRGFPHDGLGTNLIGPPEVVRDRLRAYRDCGVTTLRVNPIGRDVRECIAGMEILLDLVNDVNDSAASGGAAITGPRTRPRRGAG
jgi:hypothetical protein